MQDFKTSVGLLPGEFLPSFPLRLSQDLVLVLQVSDQLLTLGSLGRERGQFTGQVSMALRHILARLSKEKHDLSFSPLQAGFVGQTYLMSPLHLFHLLTVFPHAVSELGDHLPHGISLPLPLPPLSPVVLLLFLLLLLHHVQGPLDLLLFS